MAVRRPLVRVGGKNVQLPAGDVISGAEGFFRTEPITATSSGQTSFTVPGGYTPGAIFVSLNGASLPPADFTATDGATVALASGDGVVAGSVLLVHVLSAFEVADALPLGGTAADSNKYAGLLPPPSDGKQYALKDGAWVEVAASGSGAPVLSVSWAIARANIGAGDAALDGQVLSRATYPDAWAQAQAIGLVITEAEWQADPLKRGFFSSGDGSTTFRLPDHNGKQTGSLGAVFQRGDGVLSAAVAGAIQRDALQGHRHATTAGVWVSSPAIGIGAPGGGYNAAINSAVVEGPISDGTNGTPRTASETRPLSVTGCWVIKLFGAVVNVGSVDAAQLASDYANLVSRTDRKQDKSLPVYTTTTRTLSLTDAWNYVRPVTSSAITLTVPTNASVAFELGTEITIRASGTITIAAASGVTIYAPANGTLVLASRMTAVLKKVDTDVWDLIGQTVAA